MIGTPGRLLNLINDKKLKLHKLEAIVIDEADELLGEAETLADCREIITHAPRTAAVSFFQPLKLQSYRNYIAGLGSNQL